MSRRPRPRPQPPHPGLVRRPGGPFGWLEARLLHEEWLARAGPSGSAVLLLLALAADRSGSSFYGRERMSVALSLPTEELDRATDSGGGALLVIDVDRFRDLNQYLGHASAGGHHPHPKWRIS